MVLLIAFWSPKQFKIDESFIESMAKQLEAHLHDETKLWSSIVLFNQTSSEDVYSKNEWLGFLSLGVKEAG